MAVAPPELDAQVEVLQLAHRAELTAGLSGHPQGGLSVRGDQRQG